MAIWKYGGVYKIISLLSLIEEKRRELNELFLEKSCFDEIVLQKSQEIDMLLNILNRGYEDKYLKENSDIVLKKAQPGG